MGPQFGKKNSRNSYCVNSYLEEKTKGEKFKRKETKTQMWNHSRNKQKEVCYHKDSAKTCILTSNFYQCVSEVQVI